MREHVLKTVPLAGDWSAIGVEEMLIEKVPDQAETTERSLEHAA
jgi:hypothetical protein